MDSESDQEVSGDERDKIKQEISNLTFEELLELKEKMGSKLYNKTFQGEKKKASKEIVQRANKNRPREMSSKIRPKSVKSTLTISKSKKTLPRDPRFDPLCGQFEEREFKSNYRFLKDVRLQEKEQLQLELKNCGNPERAETIKMLIRRITNQIREQEKREKEQLQSYEEKKEIRDKLKKGEHVKFKKKSVKKVENLVEKYETLMKSNRLQKHIEKRSKKLSSRNKQQMEQSITGI